MSTTESPRKNRDALAMLQIRDRDEPPRPSPIWRLVKAGLVLAVLAALTLAGYVLFGQRNLMSSTSRWLPEAIQARPEVRVSQVVVEKGRTGSAVVVATGYLESRRQAMIGARAAGRIEVVNVEEGSKVKSGEIMAIVEHRDVDAALGAAKATLERAQAELGELEVQIAQAQADFVRADELWKRRSTSEADFDRARFARDGALARKKSLQAAVHLAEARVQETEQQQQNMIIRAPFDGTVISKDAEVGESILPGGMGEASGRGSVVTIADLDHLEVDCDVKEDYINRVVPGAPAEVTVDAVPDVRYKGRVRKIIPMGDRARATIKVKVELLDADEKLFPDMSATAYFLPQDDAAEISAEQRRIFCAADAIQSDGMQSFVWLVDADRRASRVDVKTGEERDGRVEIMDGLQGGERVIIGPFEGIEAGVLVKLRE